MLCRLDGIRLVNRDADVRIAASQWKLLECQSHWIARDSAIIRLPKSTKQNQINNQ
jgi:hypothetical protein